ncbi:hypothetical protein JCM10296v2_006496 [Rhodotorula toruloides]
MGWLSRTRNLVWPEPNDPLERSLVRKADALILSYLCLNFCINYLDRVNFINAYVSGLGTALHMKGREYNACISSSSPTHPGFAIAQIPQNLLLLLIPPRYLFPLNGVVWGVLTAAGAGATKVQHLYVIKFFQGMAECSTFIGAHYILGSWYRPSEIGRRAALFSASAQIASIFSGSLQTVPIALIGIYSFPDTPLRTTSRLFTPQERALAIARLPQPPRAQKRSVGVDWTLVRRVLGRWELWGLALVWTAGGALESYSSWGTMPLWMKAQRTTQGKPTYTVAELNHYPLGMPAVAIAALLLTAIWTDRRTKDRYAVNLVVALAVLVSSLIVLISGLKPVGAVPRGAVYFAFYLSAVSFAGQMSNFAWANELLRDDEEARSVVLAGMNVISYAFNAWFQIAFFPASASPAFTRGSSLMIAFCPLLALFTVCVRGLQVRTERRRAFNVVAEEAKEGKEEKDGEGKRSGTGTAVVGEGDTEGKELELER